MIKIEINLNKTSLSKLKENLIKEMQNDNKHWKNYYVTNKKKLMLNSQLDRMRYYLNFSLVKNSIKKLKKNINNCEYQKIIQFLANKKMKNEFIKIKNLKISNFHKIIYVFMSETLSKYYSASGFKIN